MLESVRSRQTWGFLILTVLPASAGIGYYLRSRKDQHLVESVTPETVASTPTGQNAQQVRDKILLLRKRELRLVQEDKELDDKLNRLQLQRDQQPPSAHGVTGSNAV